VQHEVVAAAGHLDRVELDRAQPTQDIKHGVGATDKRPRRREELPGNEKAARILPGDLHLEGPYREPSRGDLR
jgi:hypothetical protein